MGFGIAMLMFIGLASAPEDGTSGLTPVFDDASLRPTSVKIIAHGADLQIEAHNPEAGVHIIRSGGNDCDPWISRPTPQTLQVEATCLDSQFEVSVPGGTEVSVVTESGNTSLSGRFAAVDVVAESGSIEFNPVVDEPGDSRSVSLVTDSGDVSYYGLDERPGKAQKVNLATESGQIHANADATEALTARSVSGDVQLEISDEVGRVDVRSNSGDVSVRGVSPDRAVRLASTSGEITNEASDPVSEKTGAPVNVTTSSGDIDLAPQAR